MSSGRKLFRIALLFSLLLLQGCALPGPVHMSHGTGEGQRQPLTVVLSFDYEDLGHEAGGRNMASVLDMLDRRNLSAAFFVLGATAERYPSRVREVVERGHLVGMHTYVHSLPIFSREDAERIGRIYGVEGEVEWRKSFQTPEEFMKDIIKTRRVIREAAGVEAVMFRAPSMVVNWTDSEAYYRVLREEGVAVDSSVYQDFENPRAYYLVEGVVEVPVVAFESRLKNPEKALELAEKCSRAGVPFHLVVHPQSLDHEGLAKLEEFLDRLEATYDVRYLRIDEVRKAYENIY